MVVGKDIYAPELTLWPSKVIPLAGPHSPSSDCSAGSNVDLDDRPSSSFLVPHTRCHLTLGAHLPTDADETV